MSAILRRVLGVGLILAGIICLCWPAVGVWYLDVKDFGAMSERRKTKVKDHIQTVQGQSWDDLFARAQQGNDGLHLKYCTAPLANMHQDTGQSFFYFQLPGKTPYLLSASLLSISHVLAFKDNGAWSLTHPWAWLAPWLVLAGLLIYILLPRPRKQPNQYRYSLMRSQIGVDLLAVFLGGIFLVLPILIISQNVKYVGVLSAGSGWTFLTLICWFLALLGLVNLAISAWYEALYFETTTTSLRKVNLAGSKEYSFDQMIEMKPAVWRAPSWLRGLSGTLVLIKPRLAIPAVLGSQVTAPAVEIPCRDGRTLTIFVKHLVGWKELEQTLLDSGLKYVDGEGNKST